MKIRFFSLFLLVTLALPLVACTPINPVTEETAAASESQEDTQIVVCPVTAKVIARSLRVRQAPLADADVISGLKEDESYCLLDLSEDGNWALLAIPAIEPSGQGWVDTNYINVSGDLTALPPVSGAPLSSAPQAASSTETTSEDKQTSADEQASADEQIVADTPEAQTASGQEARVVIESARLRVRQEPRGEAEIVGFVYNDERYAVLSISEDGKWVEIAGKAGTDNPDGGWVSAEFVEIQ